MQLNGGFVAAFFKTPRPDRQTDLEGGRASEDFQAMPEANINETIETAVGLGFRKKLTSRFGRVLTSGAAGIVSRGVAMISPLVTIPMTLSHLGVKGFGLWMTITSMTSALAFADLGLGNSILSDVSRAKGKGDDQSIKVILSTTYACLILLCIELLPIGAIIAWGVDWGKQLGIANSEIGGSASTSILMAIFLFVIGIPIGLIYKVQIAFQKAYLANIWQTMGSLVAMGLIVGCVKTKLSLPYLVAAFFGGPVLVWLINSFLFYSARPAIRPSVGTADGAILKKLLLQSAEFLVLSILLTFGTALDTALVSKVAGLESGGKYAIALRVAALLSLAPTMMYLPLWAANGEAIGRGDFNWVRRTVWKMTWVCAAITLVIGAPLLAGAEFVFRTWLHTNAGIPKFLLAGLLGWAFLQCAAAPRFMVLNAMVVTRPQIWMYFGFLLVSFPLKIMAITHWGIEWTPWVNCAVFAAMVLPWVQGVYRGLTTTSEQKI